MPLEDRRFRAEVDCRYIVHTPDSIDRSVFVVALHGYGMDAATMLRLTALWFPDYRIASIQAPHPFYRDVKTGEVGYSWTTPSESLESVRLHHDILRHVLDDVAVPIDRRLLIGFSQSVGLNYRFAATYPALVGGVIGVCGGIPGNWEAGDYRPVSVPLLHVARTEDEVYPISMVRGYADRLRTRAVDVEYLEFPGGHRFPSLGGPAVSDWVKRKVLRMNVANSAADPTIDPRPR